MNEFYDFWNETQKKFGYYFENRTSSLFIDERYYDYSFLFNPNKDIKREKVTLIGRGKRVKINDFEYKLLKIISANSRISNHTIANLLESKSNVIKKQIQKLISLGVIKGFRIDVDFSKLGYQIIRINLFLNDYNKRDNIINYVKNYTNLVFIDTYSGEADLELEFYLKNVNNLNKIINDLKLKFPNAIKNYQSININHYHKFLYMPEFDNIDK
jgi:Lrp/AsnC family leucine-responsive transcriptional regulator